MDRIKRELAVESVLSNDLKMDVGPLALRATVLSDLSAAGDNKASN